MSGDKGQEQVEKMRENLKRLEKIVTCLKKQVKRLGGDPYICDTQKGEESDDR